jgi:hypothetical protein
MAAHPLFPAAQEGKAPPEVVTIHVQRTPDGVHYRAFGPEELQSLEQLYMMFGGGQYTLLARNESHITARQSYTLPGKSKPLNPVAEDEPETPAAVGPVQQQMSGDMSLVLAMMQMMQTASNNQLQMMQAQSQAQTELVVAMLGQGQTGAQQHVQTMQALHDRHAQSQAQLMQAILEGRQQVSAGASGSELETFMRGIEFAREMTDEPDDELSDLLETVGPLAQAFMAGEGSGLGPAVPPPPPPPKKGGGGDD